jgi:hypothetical protein
MAATAPRNLKMTSGESNKPHVGQMRVEYRRRPLREEDLIPDAFQQFAAWFREACDADSRTFPGHRVGDNPAGAPYSEALG